MEVIKDEASIEIEDSKNKKKIKKLVKNKLQRMQDINIKARD